MLAPILDSNWTPPGAPQARVMAVSVWNVLADLVRFELTVSSMPFKKYQSVTDVFRQNKRLRGREVWTPVNSTGRLLLRLDSVRTPGLHIGLGPLRAFAGGINLID